MSGWKVTRSSQFKRDAKRYRHDEKRLNELYELTQIIEQTGRVPQEYRPHKLHGGYEGCMECHIEDDFLLIWIDEATNTVKLLRLGTHQELFGR